MRCINPWDHGTISSPWSRPSWCPQAKLIVAPRSALNVAAADVRGWCNPHFKLLFRPGNKPPALNGVQQIVYKSRYINPGMYIYILIIIWSIVIQILDEFHLLCKLITWSTPHFQDGTSVILPLSGALERPAFCRHAMGHGDRFKGLSGKNKRKPHGVLLPSFLSFPVDLLMFSEIFRKGGVCHKVRPW